MAWKSNKWVRYLEGYCQGKNQIQDEYVRKVAKRLGLDKPLNIEFLWQEEIISKFNDEESCKVIILTGTAGDGKTKLCRDIVKAKEQAAFDEEVWNSESFFCDDSRTIVKDFSELKPEETSTIIKELATVLDTKETTKPILIAVNDGILVEAIDEFINLNSKDKVSDLAIQLKEIIEDKINLGFSNCEGAELVNLINLSKLDAKSNFTLILETILNHEGWTECTDCDGFINQTCPIISKQQLLKQDAVLRENLSNVILLLQLNNEHFTIREILNLVCNTLLASTPKVKQLKITNSELNYEFFSCRKVANVKERKELIKESTVDVGFWGLNLGPHKMKNARPYAAINELGFGELSTNYWDNKLKTVQSVDDSSYLQKLAQSAYVRVVNEEMPADFWNAAIRRARIHLYFAQVNTIKAFDLQRYTSFGYYKQSLYDALQNAEECFDDDLIAMVVLALNRIFHGRFISRSSGDSRLYVPEVGHGTVAPITIFHGAELLDSAISICKISSDFGLSKARIEPTILFLMSDRSDLKLALTVELFDFLYNVANGSPPNTTNPRLYKKLLIFRSKLGARMSINHRARGQKKIVTYEINEGNFHTTTLKVRHD